MIVERTDFISVPVRDMERATRFYEETLGLPKVTSGAWPEFQLGENVSLYLVEPQRMGVEHWEPHA
ncbi:MAG TPA: VOC family protein, partial [Gaiellaceae bacterium]|nr:VOC family protein [Gaiellaceae bacterium]